MPVFTSPMQMGLADKHAAFPGIPWKPQNQKPLLCGPCMAFFSPYFCRPVLKDCGPDLPPLSIIPPHLHIKQPVVQPARGHIKYPMYHHPQQCAIYVELVSFNKSLTLHSACISQQTLPKGFKRDQLQHMSMWDFGKTQVFQTGMIMQKINSTRFH